MSCKEKNYELISQMVIYADEDITFKKPFQLGEKIIKTSDYSVDISKGVQVPMNKLSCKASESFSVSLEGPSYLVSIDWEIGDYEEENIKVLSRLSNGVNHLIMTVFGGGESLVRSCEDGYSFTMEEDAGVLKCKLSIMNVAGIQRIME